MICFGFGTDFSPQKGGYFNRTGVALKKVCLQTLNSNFPRETATYSSGSKAQDRQFFLTSKDNNSMIVKQCLIMSSVNDEQC